MSDVQTTPRQVETFAAILTAYIAGHPQERIGQAIMNLLRDSFVGAPPSGYDLWNKPSDILVMRAEMNYERGQK